jgi:hypothetical protein
MLFVLSPNALPLMYLTISFYNGAPHALINENLFDQMLQKTYLKTQKRNILSKNKVFFTLPNFQV